MKQKKCSEIATPSTPGAMAGVAGRKRAAEGMMRTKPGPLLISRLPAPAGVPCYALEPAYVRPAISIRLRFRPRRRIRAASVGLDPPPRSAIPCCGSCGPFDSPRRLGPPRPTIVAGPGGFHPHGPQQQLPGSGGGSRR